MATLGAASREVIFPATVILKMILVQQNVKNQICIFIRLLVVLWHGCVRVVVFLL